MIKPTIGRMVWYTIGNWDTVAVQRDQPLSGQIAYVWNDRLVNLFVIDANGIPLTRTSVPLLQDDDPRPEQGFFCEWMPFQKGQAQKTEALEAKLEGKA